MSFSKKFKAFVIEDNNKSGIKEIDFNFLMKGNVLVKVSYIVLITKTVLLLLKKKTNN